MTTKELIFAEIERLKSKYRHNGLWTSSFQSDLAMAKIESMNELLSFLDTLPDEPVTDCHDLKEHMKEWVELMVGASFPEQDGDFISEEDYRDVIKKTALHFAEWQRRQMMDKAYEEEVQEVYRDDDGIHCCVSVGTDYKPGTIIYVITIPKEDAEQ